MSAFKLLLCLAGLGTYLLVKQFAWTGPGSGEVRPAPRLRDGTVSPSTELPLRSGNRPQTTPHTEVLRTRDIWAAIQPIELAGLFQA